MVITAPLIAGLDWYINQVQIDLFNYLAEAWHWVDPYTGVTTRGSNLNDFALYPRISRTQKDGGYIAELYEPNGQGGGEYREVFWDDSLKGLAFFGTGQKTEISSQYKSEVHLVCFGNTAALMSGVDSGYRMDELLRNQFAAFFKGNPWGFELQSVETGIQNVLREYPGSRRDNRLQAADLGPVHAFRLNFIVYYDPERGASADLGLVL